MWLISSFSASNLFSLRLSSATSSGGKSHLIPTPYTVKMALINASFRWDGKGEEDFYWLRPLKIAFKLPDSIVVNNSFVKILKEAREGDETYQNTVGLRQYVYWGGLLYIAFDISNLQDLEKKRLQRLLTMVNYFGKRGSFVQYQKQWETKELSEDFSVEWQEMHESRASQSIDKGMVIQIMDDMAGQSSFDAFNSYSPTRLKLFEDRVFKTYVLMGVKGATSHGYTHYQSLPSS
ncbi:hypothetical protein F9B85_08600 [Heliorestis acidaminivorans]|uniref:Uncharacterized protein n=1 Tax=Heliorestis acidaminivorans TaxID=553427 RepID=A0A6I0F0B5_9FIRM|nr:hypothetical protein [Heliorestis acidaminivorans]KAB2952701.1 hypothetical protein F9B85_08600 [Heliorestis acidaminivorans]